MNSIKFEDFLSELKELDFEDLVILYVEAWTKDSKIEKINQFPTDMCEHFYSLRKYLAEYINSVSENKSANQIAWEERKRKTRTRA